MKMCIEVNGVKCSIVYVNIMLQMTACLGDKLLPPSHLSEMEGWAEANAAFGLLCTGLCRCSLLVL